MNNHMYMIPGNVNFSYNHPVNFADNDTRLWGGAFGYGFGRPFGYGYGYGMPFGFGGPYFI